MASAQSSRPIVVIGDDLAEDLPTIGPPLDHSFVPMYRSGNMTFMRGKTVELRNGDFLRIKHILQNDQTSKIFLRGPLFRRTNELAGRISAKLNETCWIEEMNSDALDEITYTSLDDVIRIRQLRMTNQLWEDLNVSHTWGLHTITYKMIQEEGILFCRAKLVTVYERQKRKRTAVESFIRTLTTDEADTGYAEDPKEARKRYQEEHHGNPSQSSFSLVGNDLGETGPQYTYGDAFSGAGGMSSGAEQAGLLVKWGLEIDEMAARTYQLNFQTAICENASVFDFINPRIYRPEEYRVDVLHMSPPCQSFSPMQTVKGADYEQKQAPILSIEELIKMIRPRIITMEETFGLLFNINIDFFNMVIRTLNNYGYSVRWKVLNLAHYGTPQPRRRLVIIAAGPGETLPSFPKPTHLNNHVSINSLIADIPAHDQHHRPTPYPISREPYDADGQLPRLLDTHGGGNYHPSGLRAFTIREFACLQTFPRDFIFKGTRTEVLQQIGNAVPPTAAKAIFQEIVRSLEKTDREG